MPKTIFGTLGTLTLVAKQDGRDLQSFPIDSERVTFGRWVFQLSATVQFSWSAGITNATYAVDAEQNWLQIRLYFADVSKFHCEVIFDLLTDKVGVSSNFIIQR